MRSSVVSRDNTSPEVCRRNSDSEPYLLSTASMMRTARSIRLRDGLNRDTSVAQSSGRGYTNCGSLVGSRKNSARALTRFVGTRSVNAVCTPL